MAARTRRGRNHAGLFVDRLKHRSCESSTENAKSGQVLVRTRSGEKGRPVAAPDETLLQPCGAVRRSPQTPELRTFNGKTQRADRFWFAPGRIKPNPSTILKGGMSGVLNLETAVKFLPRPRRPGLSMDLWLPPKPAKTDHFFAGVNTRGRCARWEFRGEVYGA